MTLKVELGFTDAGVNPPFFTLNDATKGKLDSEVYVLGGGEGFVDVTEYVRTAGVQGGKSRELDRYDARQASVTFNNSSRAFDPTFEASPFYGQIVPRRRMRVKMDGVTQFLGLVDDWSIEYDPSGYSVATCQAFDGFSQLTNLATLTELSLPSELTGSRINEILDAIEWPSSERSIDTGRATLAADDLALGTNALGYLQRVTDSEPGDLFVNKAGEVEFRDRLNVATSSSLVFSDVSGIGYQGVKAVYGSELLYNNITVTSGTATASASDAYSISLYGQQDLTVDTLLENPADLSTMAAVLLQRYKQPEFRFENLEVNLNAVTPEVRADILALELSDIIKVELTPGDIGPTIERYGKVLSLSYSFTPEGDMVEIGLESGASSFFILDDLAFGKLNEDALGW